MNDTSHDTSHVVMPVGEPKGAVIVLQEAFGVTPWLLRVCERLAGQGHAAVAPVLYADGAVYGYDDLAGARGALSSLTMEQVLDRCDEALARTGLPWERAAVIGFCIGGLLAYGVATRRDCAAAITFYGGPVDKKRLPDLEAMTVLTEQVRAPWLGLYGSRDAFIPVASVDALADGLAEAGQVSSVVMYEADHGFACEDRPNAYDSAASTSAFAELTAWLAEHLR